MLRMTPSCVGSAPPAWKEYIWLVLLSFTMIDTQLRESHQIVPLAVLLLRGIQGEQPPPPLHQVETLRQSQGICWLLPELANQSTQLQWEYLCSHIHQQTVSHLLIVQTSGEVQRHPPEWRSIPSPTIHPVGVDEKLHQSVFQPQSWQRKIEAAS